MRTTRCLNTAPHASHAFFPGTCPGITPAVTETVAPAEVRAADRVLAVNEIPISPAKVGQPAGLLVEHVSTPPASMAWGSGCRTLTVWIGDDDMMDMGLGADARVLVRRAG